MNFNARYQKVKKLFKSKYDPDKYWIEWGKRVRGGEEFEKRPHKLDVKMLRVNALLKLLDTRQFNSVLDFGCGWGFVSKFLLEKYKIDDYVAFDASPDRVIEAKEFLKDFNVELHTSMLHTFKTDKKFDLVLGTGVLHHTKPEDIKNTMKHLVKYAKKDFIHDDPPPGYRSDSKIEKTTFNFFHDYKQIWQELGYDVNIIPIPDLHSRAIYHVKINQE